MVFLTLWAVLSSSMVRAGGHFANEFLFQSIPIVRPRSFFSQWFVVPLFMEVGALELPFVWLLPAVV